MLNYEQLIQGESIQTLVRVKPNINYQKEDIKVVGNTVRIIDDNNREIESTEVQNLFSQDYNIDQIYDNIYQPYISPFLQGYSLSFFAFGSTGSGKSASMEGTSRDPGIIQKFAQSMFKELDDKKYHANQSNQYRITNYSYGVRVRFVKVYDEEITDLLNKSNVQFQDALQVQEDIWEGPKISNSTWCTVNNYEQLLNVFNQGLINKNNQNLQNEFGKLSHKTTTLLTLELLQTSTVIDTREPLILLNRVNFFVLPSSDILQEQPETIKIKQGATLNKSIIAFTQLVRDLQLSRQQPVIYETSILTHLMKDCLGGNSLTVGLFCVKNGDSINTKQSLQLMKYCQKIKNNAIVNDNKAIGLLKKYRLENLNTDNQNILGGDDIHNDRILDLEKKVIGNQLDKMRGQDEKQRLAQKLQEIREKYNALLKDKSDLQNELIKCEEDKLEVSKALVDLQIENTRLMEIVQNEKFENNNNLLNAEQDVLNLNIREEKALKVVQELQDKLQEALNDKRDLELEFISLKKNYITTYTQLDEERVKNQNIGVELINMVNENKALNQEMNDIYKKQGSTSNENGKFIAKIEKLENENQQQREALIFAKSEIERLKTEMLKYEIQEKQHQLELDTKKMELERGLIDLTKEKQNEFHKINKDTEFNIRRQQEDRLLWESQKMELQQKNKMLERRIIELEDRQQEVIRTNEEYIQENSKLLFQMDEMRNVYRQKIFQFQTQVGNDKRIGYDLNSREEILKNYKENENQLKEKLEKEKRYSKTLTLELRALKGYSRQLKYLAEDWAPVGIPLPEILQKEPPSSIDDQQIPIMNQDLVTEVERLRKQNRKLEEENRLIQQNSQNFDSRIKEQPDINKRIEYEMNQINNRSNMQNINSEQLRNERNELQQENIRLVQLLKDNKKWDIYLLQQDNERLQKHIQQQQIQGSIAPSSFDANNLKQKIMYYEKMVKALEKERAELMVKNTMLDEQNKHLQHHLEKTSYDYQKKLQDIKRNTQNY